MQFQVAKNLPPKNCYGGSHDGYSPRWHISSNVIPNAWTASEIAAFRDGSTFSVLELDYHEDRRSRTSVERVFKLVEVSCVRGN